MAKSATKHDDFLELLKKVFSLLILSCEMPSLLAGTSMWNMSLAQQKLTLMFNNFNCQRPNITICFCKFFMIKLLVTTNFIL